MRQFIVCRFVTSLVDGESLNKVETKEMEFWNTDIEIYNSHKQKSKQNKIR
jgi:hypothetical protein